MIPRTALLLCLLMSPLAQANDSLSEALPILQSRYVDFAALQAQPSDTLDNLVLRSNGEIIVQPAAYTANPVTVSAPVVLPEGLIYWRLDSFPAETAAVAAQLKSLVAGGASGVILDLRSISTPNDFDGAARVAGLFVRTGQPLFSLQPTGRSAHQYSGAGAIFAPGPIAVLINAGTAGAGEALAAALKANGALTLGRSTAGAGAEFASQPLSGGEVLKYVDAQVTMADGTGLWRHAVQPDIGILTDPKKERVVLNLIGQGKVLEVIRESARSHRLSEATLVRGEDPSVEAYLVPTVKTVSVPQDATLVEALDSLKAIRLSQGVTTGSAPATVQ